MGVGGLQWAMECGWEGQLSMWGAISQEGRLEAGSRSSWIQRCPSIPDSSRSSAVSRSCQLGAGWQYSGLPSIIEGWQFHKCQWKKCSFQPKLMQNKIIICPPPWPEAKEKSFAEQMRFLGLRPGGWAWYFQHQFRFSMCYPKGAHSLGHRRGQLPTFWAFWIQFHIFNVLPQGGSFVGSP